MNVTWCAAAAALVLVMCLGHAHDTPWHFGVPKGVEQQDELPLIDTGGRTYKYGVKWNRAQ